MGRANIAPPLYFGGWLLSGVSIIEFLRWKPASLGSSHLSGPRGGGGGGGPNISIGLNF